MLRYQRRSARKHLIALPAVCEATFLTEDEESGYQKHRLEAQGAAISGTLWYQEFC